MTEEIKDQDLSSGIECPNCGALGVQTRFVNDKFKYGAGSDAIELEVKTPFRRCPTCEFEYTDADAEDIKHEAICRHLQRMIPGEVAGVRKRYNLRRDVFATRTRLGEASLARWESGQLIQNAAYDNYLYLLTFEENMKRLEQRSQNVIVEAEIRVESSVEEALGDVRSERVERSQNRFRALVNPERVRREACGFHLRRRSRAS